MSNMHAASGVHAKLAVAPACGAHTHLGQCAHAAQQPVRGAHALAYKIGVRSLVLKYAEGVRGRSTRG